MTEHNREHGQRWSHGEQGTGYGQGQGGVGSNFGSGQQAQGGYGQGSYGYGQGGVGSQQPQGQNQQSGQGGGFTNSMRSMFPGSTVQRGKPPRGYQRSDERLREMICERLMEEHSLDASDVEVSVQGGRVTLEGSIDSRLAKYQIEDIVEHMGVNDVQNNLRVSRGKQAPGHGDEPSSQSGSSGGVSSLGMSGSGTAGVDRTTTGGATSDGSK